MVTLYNFTSNQVITSIQITDCRGSRGKAAYTDVTHPLNPPPVRGTFVETRKGIRIWNIVSVKLYVIAIFFCSVRKIYSTMYCIILKIVLYLQYENSKNINQYFLP